jgi:ribonuclease HI
MGVDGRENHQQRLSTDFSTKRGKVLGFQQMHQMNVLTQKTSRDHCISDRPRMSELVAYVDGGSHGNPGPAGIGIVLETPGGEIIKISKWIGHQDNNVAEYAAVLEALQLAVARKAKRLQVYCDSEVVVRQMNGEYACRSPRLYSLNWTCRKLARALEFTISHIPRELNLEANHLANAAVRCRGEAFSFV